MNENNKLKRINAFVALCFDRSHYFSIKNHVGICQLKGTFVFLPQRQERNQMFGGALIKSIDRYKSWSQNKALPSSSLDSLHHLSTGTLGFPVATLRSVVDRHLPAGKLFRRHR